MPTNGEQSDDDNEPAPCKAQSLREVLFEGRVNEVTGFPESIFSNRLVLTDKDFVDASELALQETLVSRPLRGRHLESAVFIRSDLRKADFTGAKLKGADFSGARLEGAKFGCGITKKAKDEKSKGDEQSECAQMTEIKLKSAHLEGAFLKGALISDGDFTDAFLADADFTDSVLIGAKFYRTKMQRTDFTKADMRASAIRFGDQKGAIFVEARMEAVSLLNANLHNAQLNEASLNAASIARTKMDSANVSATDLSAAVFSPACLDDINWSDAIISATQIGGAMLLSELMENENSAGGLVHQGDGSRSSLPNLCSQKNFLMQLLFHMAGVRDVMSVVGNSSQNDKIHLEKIEIHFDARKYSLKMRTAYVTVACEAVLVEKRYNSRTAAAISRKVARNSPIAAIRGGKVISLPQPNGLFDRPYSGPLLPIDRMFVAEKLLAGGNECAGARSLDEDTLQRLRREHARLKAALHPGPPYRLPAPAQ